MAVTTQDWTFPIHDGNEVEINADSIVVKTSYIPGVGLSLLLPSFVLGLNFSHVARSHDGVKMVWTNVEPLPDMQVVTPPITTVKNGMTKGVTPHPPPNRKGKAMLDEGMNKGKGKDNCKGNDQCKGPDYW